MKDQCGDETRVRKEVLVIHGPMSTDHVLKLCNAYSWREIGLTVIDTIYKQLGGRHVCLVRVFCLYGKIG